MHIPERCLKRAGEAVYDKRHFYEIKDSKYKAAGDPNELEFLLLMFKVKMEVAATANL